MIKQAIAKIKTQLGWQGIAGIVLLAIAGEFHFMALKPMEQETSYLHNLLEVARSKVSMQGRTFSLGSRQKELAMFYDSLPEEKDVTDVLASIYSTAEASGVQFKEAAYHLEEKDKHLSEYTVTFPVKGEYMKIRQFIFHVLVKHPAMALDQINFQRDKINDATLKAEIKLTLFLRPDYVKN